MIREARAAGADTILLIVAVLSVSTLQRLIACARGLGMEPLVEVHTLEEMEVAVDAGAVVLGVGAPDAARARPPRADSSARARRRDR